MKEADFFVGWSADIPSVHRRFLLRTSIGLIASAGALGIGLASNREPVGGGIWDQGRVLTLRGVLGRDPYPVLRTRALGGGLRTVFLSSPGKAGPDIDARYFGQSADITGTLITRGRHAMMAVTSVQVAPAEFDPAEIATPIAIDRGPVMLVGEILDAKCWFGAMRPGYGKTHKACATLCVRGGLPLAFCQTDACGEGADAPLLLDEHGRAFSRAILPLVADPVMLQGRMVIVGDVVQVRAPLSSIRRL